MVTAQNEASKGAPFQLMPSGIPSLRSRKARPENSMAITTSRVRKICVALIAALPPDSDMRLDLVQLVEGAINVQREQRIAGDAIRLERCDQCPPRIADIGQRPRSRESLYVPKFAQLAG
ncbi:hypothetical protein ACVOMV_17970 [Mesorhizobium atlanticum]